MQDLGVRCKIRLGSMHMHALTSTESRRLADKRDCPECKAGEAHSAI